MTAQAALFALPAAQPSHPAEYTEALYPTMARMLTGCTKVLDPFAGVGNIFQLERWQPGIEFYGVELEKEWASCHPKTEQGNALHLRWKDGYFDGICTSPAYGSRMADTLMDDYERITYTAKLGRELHPDNAGAMQWGDKYRAFHIAAWKEAARVLKENGTFVLNIKDHFRKFKRQPVTAWHIETLRGLGFEPFEEKRVACPGMRFGQNADLRMEYESVILFRYFPYAAAHADLIRVEAAYHRANRTWARDGREIPF